MTVLVVPHDDDTVSEMSRRIGGPGRERSE